MIIDVHAHFVPGSILESLAARGQDFGIDLIETEPGCRCCRFEDGQQIRPFFPGLLDVERRIAEMDGQGIGHQVMTMWTDIFGYQLDAPKGHAWHREMNDGLIGLCADHPERFSFMASAALQDASGAALEIERCAAAGAAGVIVAANVNGVNLGECPLDEVWAACAQLDLPVFIHPALPVAPERAGRFGLNQVVAYTNDTTLAIGSMILSGVLDRYPDLVILLSHGGGSLPWLVGRFDRVHEAMDGTKTGDVAAHPPSAYLHRMLYDTILHKPETLRHLAELVGIDKLLIGTDAPFPPGDTDPLGSLRKAGFDARAVARIGTENPRRHFRHLKA